MSRKYQHKAPRHTEPSALRTANKRLFNENQALRTENEVLQTALRLLTSEDKQTLIDAVKYLDTITKSDTHTVSGTIFMGSSNGDTVTIRTTDGHNFYTSNTP